MKPGQIVLEKLIKDRKVVIRHMDKDDAEQLLEYINKLSKEQTMITFQGEQLTLEQEQQYIEETIKKMNKGTTLHLVLFVDGKVSGTSHVALGERTHTHVGTLGLSLDSSVRGMGLGRLLFETAIVEAKKELKGLRMIDLTVFANNEVAIKLYESCGFKLAGRIPERIAYKGSYVDEIVMYLKV